jgi:multidrug efflux pump subunit AcrB
MLLIGGLLSGLQMPKDIFPAINIPVVAVIWMYNGLPAQEMERRITTVSERALTTSVDNIEHMESNSFNGISLSRFTCYQGASVDAAITEVTAECQNILKALPTGTTPPNVLSYNAANVPVLELSVGGAKFSEQQLYDYATNFIRTQLATVQGASIPLPYSWTDPFIFITALPGALTGIVWMPFLTRTTISVPALMGAIM